MIHRGAYHAYSSIAFNNKAFHIFYKMKMLQDHQIQPNSHKYSQIRYTDKYIVVT